jgi:5-methylcytosine-specific restriction endonuclease McrA|tara:strand:- start:20524 stop:20784 length:261 start_codon:yes stop_codon:yes gene_type:complete
MNYKKLYKQIFKDRCIEDETGEYVVCVKTGKRIYKHQLTVHNFCHIKPKSRFPELKYDPDNIEIRAFEKHGDEHTSGTFHNFLPIQ